MLNNEAIMKIISTKLKLAYSPLSARELAWAKDDEDIQRALSKAHLYMIAKKPQIYFSNVKTGNSIISLDVVNTNGRASASISTNQSLFTIEDDKDLFVRVGSNEKVIAMNGDTCETAHGLQFYKIDHAKCNGRSIDSLRQYMTPENFVLWLSPEKLLYHYRNHQLRIPNFDKSKDFFWNYEVMYIGKATEQSVFQRLDGHKTLLHILEEEIEEYKQIRDDVVLLFFEVSESDQGLLVERTTPATDVVDAIEGSNYPSIKTLLLEAEKIFVNKFVPKHNDVIFKQYPKSEDGLYSYDYDIIDYTIKDGINLSFKDIVFVGGSEGNHLVYCKGEKLAVMGDQDYQEFLSKKMMERIIK